MSIVDLLGQLAGEVDQFVVDTTASPPYVPIISQGVGRMTNADNQHELFAYRDNFTILSLGFYLPLGFEMWETELISSGGYYPMTLDLFFQRNSDSVIFVPDELPSVYLPFANYEMNLNKLMKIPMGIGDGQSFRFLVRLRLDNFVTHRVSMVGVPTDLNEMLFQCPTFCKIEHTLGMF